jgi:hypothetical protein
VCLFVSCFHPVYRPYYGPSSSSGSSRKVIEKIQTLGKWSHKAWLVSSTILPLETAKCAGSPSCPVCDTVCVLFAQRTNKSIVCTVMVTSTVHMLVSSYAHVSAEHFLMKFGTQIRRFPPLGIISPLLLTHTLFVCHQCFISYKRVAALFNNKKTANLCACYAVLGHFTFVFLSFFLSEKNKAVDTRNYEVIWSSSNTDKMRPHR